MTTEEFKIKYPHLSHLEGNDLWNAMEDSLLYEKSKNLIDYSGQMFDRDGDEIKDGDVLEIWKIDTNKGNTYRFVMLDFSKEPTEKIDYPKHFSPNKDYGKDKLKDTLKIYKRENVLYETTTYKHKSGVEITTNSPLKMCLEFWYPNSTIKIKHND